MKSKLIEHFSGMLVVTLVLLAVLAVIHSNTKQKTGAARAEAVRFGELTFFDQGDPLQKALLRDIVNIYYPGQHSKNDSLVNYILKYRETQRDNRLQRSHLTERLTGDKIAELSFMYLKFLIIYVAVMLLTYYGVQTIGSWRFRSRKREAERKNTVMKLVKKLLTTLAAFILFSPAYVIAYSIRTELNTDSMFFMILLGVISNGLLIVYANKFYAFLVAESRKGYVKTAIVKNLDNSYGSISIRSLLNPVKRFKGHVFDHIFRNAQMQYHSTIKEQAAFLITGLIIIEMALNIHGYLSYEMLRQMLYSNWDIVITIILFIFYTVKFTEIATDLIMHRSALKYENR